MDGHHHPSIVMTIYLNTTERETKMAKRTDARRIRAYYKKHPAAKPKDVAAALGVNIANVYYVRKTMRDKDVIDLTIAGSPLRPKARMATSADFVKPDLVNHPPHYTTGGIETIDFIEAKQLNYNLGNVVKYITRADHKGNRVEDLRKAKWYLEREILSQHI
jgi:queuine/archaeosine tRNA-ribosyltransferase